MMNRTERIARLETIIREDRLTRHEFRGRRGYRPDQVYLDETVKGCEGVPVESLLAALVPEMESGRDLHLVPDDLMPEWFASVTIWMEDRGRKMAYPDLVRTWASLLPRWDVLSVADWNRLELRTIRLGLLRERLYTRSQLIVDALRALDGAIEQNRLPDSVRHKLREHLSTQRAKLAYPDTIRIDRAIACFDEPSVKLARTVLNSACKTLKGRRSPGWADEISWSILRTLEKEIVLKEKAFSTVPALNPDAPRRKALPASSPKQLKPRTKPAS
jgi:hypothetical protein